MANLKVFYVSFGLGTILGKSYLIAYAPNEEVLRTRLNIDLKVGMLPNWCSIYTDPPTDLVTSLPIAYEAISFYNSGPCKTKQELH